MQQQIQNKEGSTNSSEPSGVDLFDSYFAKKCLCIYRRIFSIEEIENSRVLQWAFGTLLFVIFIVFQRWIGDSSITIEAVLNNRHLCWPYFQSCGDWYFLSALPYGYSQTFLYMFFFGVIVLIVYLMWKRDWVLAHVFMTILFIWEFLIIFIYSSLFIGNYNYYHIILMFVLLFLPFKLFFLKVIFVILYFLSTTIKIHEGWILGTYFTSLKTGIPLFPEVLAPLVTNFVIFMQIVGAWFLLGSHKTLQRLAVFYFVAFHLYSGLLVEYRYPATVLPMLLVLFGPMYTVTSVPLNKKALAGWALIVLLFFLQFSSIIIPGDEKITLEGKKKKYEHQNDVIVVIVSNKKTRINKYNKKFPYK